MLWKYKALFCFNSMVLLADLFSDHVLIFWGEIQKVSDKAKRTHTEHSPAGLKLKNQKKATNQPYKYPHSIATAQLSDNTYFRLIVKEGNVVFQPIFSATYCICTCTKEERQCPVASKPSSLLNAQPRHSGLLSRKIFPKHYFQTS